MKKYLKITLFIKVFLIILCGVLCIEGVHIYFDYDDNLRGTARTQILDNDIKRHEKILSLANEYALDIKLRDFEKGWKDIYGDWYGYREFLNLMINSISYMNNLEMTTISMYEMKKINLIN